MIIKNFSTQLSDIEDEINGIYTYDREVLKFDEAMLRELNEKINIMNKKELSEDRGLLDQEDHSEEGRS